MCPVNDGIMELLHFVKEKENESVKKAWEGLESWEKEFVKLLVG